jgi:DNA-binding phage protein
MSEKSVRPHLSQRQAAADCINQALEKSEIAEICHAFGAATHLHNMSDIAKKSEIERPSLDRAFSGGPTGSKFQNRFKRSERDGFPVESHGAPGRTRKAGAFSREFRII